MMEVFSILFVGAVYILPWMKARQRHHKNAKAIGALNILLGWTLLGWIIAMVWAFTDNVEKDVEGTRKDVAVV